MALEVLLVDLKMHAAATGKGWEEIAKEADVPFHSLRNILYRQDASPNLRLYESLDSYLYKNISLHEHSRYRHAARK